MKNFFLTRQFREKLILILFVGIGAFIWLSRVNAKSQVFLGEVRQTGVDRDIQLRWLAQHTSVDERQRKAIADLDPARSFDGIGLQAEISTIARAAGLNTPDIGAPTIKRTTHLAVHSVTVVLRNVEMAGLVTFYRELSKRWPHISIDKCRIDANRGNAAVVNATFDLQSVEVQTPRA